MAPIVIVVGGVGSQLALGAWLTAVPGPVKSPDAHGVRPKEFLDDVAFGVVEVAGKVGFSQRRQVAHAVDEELRVCDGVFLFQFPQERRCGRSAFGTTPRTGLQDTASQAP